MTKRKRIGEKDRCTQRVHTRLKGDIWWKTKERGEARRRSRRRTNINDKVQESEDGGFYSSEFWETRFACKAYKSLT